ncbi:MAG: response regulator [Mariprofundaceae bacterium]|nr:response regulator [Mariprofundaceae bacterium]
MPKTSHNNFYDIFKRVTSILVMLISLTSLLGWWIDHQSLANFLPSIANMTFNTALCFLLLAIALYSSRYHRTIKWWKYRLITALCISIYALLTLSQDIFSLNFGIDLFFFDVTPDQIDKPHAGRMSPNTSWAFILSGLSLALLSYPKPTTKSIKITTHIFILLIFLIAIFGIMMGVFVNDIPKDFAHFSSISLLTALSFFLIAFELALLFQRRYDDVQLNPFLYSGIQLMYKLSYPKKFTLISLTLLIPLSFLIWQEVNDLNDNIAITKLKIMGLQHIRHTRQLLKEIPEHRGMLNAHLMNPSVFSDELERKATQVNRLMIKHSKMNQQHALHLSEDKWAFIQERWQRIQTQHDDPLHLWQLHTDIITQLTKHIRDVGHHTHLSYDTNPQVHHLISIELETLPALFELMGQLRGLGTGFIAKKELSRQEAMQLNSLISQIRLQNKDLNTLTRPILALMQDHPLNNLYSHRNKILNIFLELADTQLKLNQTHTITPEYFFKIATDALQKGHLFSISNLAYIEQLLQKHIETQFTRQYTLKGISILVIICLLFLFFSFYKSVMNTIGALDSAAKSMRHGNMQQLAHLPTSDELGHVVHSFNSIAKELTRVSTHMRAVIDHSVVGILTIDEHSIIKTFNPASEKIFNYHAREVLDQSITLLIPTRFREKHLQGIKRFLKISESSEMPEHKPLIVYGLKKDQVEFPIEMSISTMKIDGQNMFIAMLRDISEQHELEMKLRHAQKMEAIGNLVGGVAHNFNNLLAGILGQVFLVKVDTPADQTETLENLDAIETITMQASDMVNQLLTFAHKDFFRTKQELSLPKLIQEAFKTIRLGIEESIDINLSMPKKDMVIYCDGAQIQQILMNMTNNARDALQTSAKKEIHIHLDHFTAHQDFKKKYPDLKEKFYALLKISDTGHGIEDKIIERIFEPFFTSKEVGKGTGLGLSTAFGTITAHQGLVEVESCVGQGTIFSIYLPLLEKNIEQAIKETKKAIVHSQHHETLLVVDDEPIITEAMRHILKGIGYHVISADNGQKGLDAFKKNQDKISVVISDVIMPVMGGVDMLKSIRELNPNMPALFITGYDQERLQLDEDERQNTAIISKPAQVAALSQTIRSLIAHTSA